ncbi:MAG TPA: hypothetical protein VE046_12305 [Steroidobacteraceae bacterium]|nr:hypothetical protein [Steroidobacteraceae bacterium]
MNAIPGEGSSGPLPAATEVGAARAALPAAHHGSPTAPVAQPGGRGRFPEMVSRQIIPYLSHQLHYVGRTGVTGLALLLSALVCFLSANAALRSQVSRLESDLAGARQLHGATASMGDLSPAARLKTLMTKLPLRSELPAVTEAIVAQAAAAGLALERGSYEVNVVRSGQIVRARLTFPVHGTYPAIRKFIDGTLLTVTGAAVDGLRLERKAIAAAEVDADIRFAIYLRNGP